MKNKQREVTQGSRTQSPAPVVRITPPHRWGVGIGEWKSAITSAESVDYPRRARLLDIYADMMMDAHLSAVIEKRRSNVTSAPVVYVGADGKTDERVGEMIAAPWFDKMLRDILDARFYGFSLFQLDTDGDGWPTCRLIQRKHVDPVRRLIKAEQSDPDGLPFDSFYNLMLVGDPYDLGMIAKAARYVIYKNNDIGDWAEFAEVFGMPIREYTYDATDEESRARLLADAQAQGAAQVYIHPEGTSMNLVESGGKGGSMEVYRALADFCNAEISKLFLGNTLTTEAGETGTQALGTVQKKGEDIILREDRKFVLNVLNYQLSDILAAMGVLKPGGRFAYEETEDVDLDKQLRIVQGLHAMGLDMDEDYLFEKFGVKKANHIPDGGKKVAEEGANGDAKTSDGHSGAGGEKKGGRGESGANGGKENGKEKGDLSDRRQLSLWERFFAEGASRRR